MEIRLDSLKKLESSSISQARGPESDEAVEVIVKVRTENYTPPNVEVRAQIDACLFTCSIPAKTLQTLEDDPNVVSIALSKKLRTNKDM
jgi:hypothetical protein